MKRIVVIGATSMIGSAIVRAAVAQKLEVLCLVRKGSARISNLPQHDKVTIEYINTDEYRCADIKGEYDVFFHLAWDKVWGIARDDTDTQVENIQYTLDAVHLAKHLGCTVFIGAGSQAEYGIVQEPLRPDMPANPQSGYGIAKYAAGKLSKLLCSQLGLRQNWVRIVSSFGPHEPSHTLIMYTINELVAGRKPELTKCEQIWDYLYCDDVARAFLAVGDCGQDGKAYPLGSGMPRRLSEYITALRDVVRPGGVLQFGKKEYYPHQPMYLCADISELTKDTGWKPEVSFEEGIRRIIDTNSKLDVPNG